MQDAEEKLDQWRRFYRSVQILLRAGPHALRRLSSSELARLIDDYQGVTADLARARSFGAARQTIDQLNRIAVAGHNLLYGQIRLREIGPAPHWFGRFATSVRAHLWAVALSATLFFGSAAVSFVAVQIYPHLGYDLLDDGFLDFDPASEENLHNIPTLARPVISSLIISNNIQVTLLAFGFGLTAGIGTSLLLIFNGIHLGSVAGWMTLHGKQRALWGWIMPHGGTELLAICLAGAAGFLLASAIIAPGQVRRTTALKRVGPRCVDDRARLHGNASHRRIDRRLRLAQCNRLSEPHRRARRQPRALGGIFPCGRPRSQRRRHCQTGSNQSHSLVFRRQDRLGLERRVVE
jgi:uncharacterized membrane protein SpoIIM required for sporulation